MRIIGFWHSCFCWPDAPATVSGKVRMGNGTPWWRSKIARTAARWRR
jgi:hypothetical protein